MTQENSTNVVEFEKGIDNMIRTALAWGAVYGRIVVSSNRWEDIREEMVESIKLNFLASLTDSEATNQLLGELLKDYKPPIALLKAARAVFMDGRVTDVSGCEVALTSCDAFEELSRVLNSAYPVYMSGLIQPEISQLCKQVDSESNRQVIEKCRQNGALWMVAKS